MVLSFKDQNNSDNVSTDITLKTCQLQCLVERYLIKNENDIYLDSGN